MHYLIKKKNKKRIDFKSIFLKVSYIAKNVIYIKKFSIPTKEQKKNHKSILLTYPGEINVNFQVERYKVKLIKSDDPLLENAQKLRYKTFLNSFRFQRKKKIDNDKYDNFCDHLVVIDTFVSDNFIVGTYRLLMNNGLNESSDLYTETEFDIKKLKKFKGRILEAGRSCVHESYRNGRIIRLLWRGLSSYINQQNVNFILGCASFTHEENFKIDDKLSYLYHYHIAPKKFRSIPLDGKGINWNLIPKKNLNKREIFKSLPPLIKAYLRVGAWVGEGAVFDKEFNTIDVCIILKKVKKNRSS